MAALPQLKQANQVTCYGKILVDQSGPAERQVTASYQQESKWELQQGIKHGNQSILEAWSAPMTKPEARSVTRRSTPLLKSIPVFMKQEDPLHPKGPPFSSSSEQVPLQLTAG